MKAILLAAGYGKRLGEITKRIPKCLINVDNQPIIKMWIDKLYNQGVREILVNTHYLSEKVNEFLSNLKYPDLNITISFEEKLLGTAGTIYANSEFIQDDCFVIHVDNYNKDDLSNFIKAHKKRPQNCIMTMMCNNVDSCQNFGMVTINKKNILIDFQEKPQYSKSNLANSAIYILSPRFIYDTRMIKNKLNFSTDIIPQLLGKVYCFITTNENIDIGLKENLFKINSNY